MLHVPPGKRSWAAETEVGWGVQQKMLQLPVAHTIATCYFELRRQSELTRIYRDIQGHTNITFKNTKTSKSFDKHWWCFCRWETIEANFSNIKWCVSVVQRQDLWGQSNSSSHVRKRHPRCLRKHTFTDITSIPLTNIGHKLLKWYSFCQQWKPLSSTYQT